MGFAALFATTAALAGPPALPPLPARGIAVSTRGGITLLDVRGRRLAGLEGYTFAPEPLIQYGFPRLRDRAWHRWRLDVDVHRLVRDEGGLPLAGGARLSRNGRTWVVRRRAGVVMRMRFPKETPFLDEDRAVVSTVRRAVDVRTGRPVGVPRRCVLASRRAPRWILLCGRPEYGSITPTSIEQLVAGKRERLAGPAYVYQGRAAGHWQYVRAAPDGRLLAQWSGECESPAAFLVTAAGARGFGARSDESIALGWLTDGRALVYFPRGLCGGTFRAHPGVYVVGGDQPRLIVATRLRDSVALWG
jgi:hypothetical protein